MSKTDRPHFGLLLESPTLQYLAVHFYRCDALLALLLAVSVCLSVCLSQVDVLSIRMDDSSWFLALELPSPIPHCVKRNPGCSKLWT